MSTKNQFMVVVFELDPSEPQIIRKTWSRSGFNFLHQAKNWADNWKDFDFIRIAICEVLEVRGDVMGQLWSPWPSGVDQQTIPPPEDES